MSRDSLQVLALDPGLATCGATIVLFTKLGATPGLYQPPAIVGMSLFTSEKTKKKLNVLASDDNVERMTGLHTWLLGLCNKYECQVMAAESQSWPRNAGASAKVGMAWGVIVSLAEQHRLSIAQTSPQAVKQRLCGSKSASKEEVAGAVNTRMRYTQEASDQLLTIPASQREHLYDSAAVGFCAPFHPVWRHL